MTWPAGPAGPAGPAVPAPADSAAPAGPDGPTGRGEPVPTTPPVPPTPPGRFPVRRTVALAAFVAAVVGAGVGVGSYAALDHPAKSPSIIVTTGPAPGTSDSAGTVAEAAAVIAPSVVTINVAGSAGAGTGSGVIIRSDGYVLTNDHVVTLDAASPASGNQITVTLSDGSALSASVIGTDVADDLAVVKLTGRTALSAATFAKSSQLRVGQQVVAVGAPLGLSNTVTSGIVSALDRPVQAGTSGESIFNAIQTDAAINPGNSGGPLVDLAGHVVGINSAIAATGNGSSGNIGIGFAVPADQATRMAAQLIATGRATHAVIGVTVSSATAAQGDGPTSVQGATITGVTPGGPAARAGIRVGDVVTAVGRQRIDDATGLIAVVRSYAPGARVSVTITRDGAPDTVAVTLAASAGG